MEERERERGINKKREKKGKNGEEKEERLRGEKWLSKTHFLHSLRATYFIEYQ